MSMRQAFDALHRMQARPMDITRFGSPNIVLSIYVAPSNYFRTLEVSGNVTDQGREFVLSKTNLDAVGFPYPKKNDRLFDTEMGNMTIKEVQEMFGIGAELIGFRVRTG